VHQQHLARGAVLGGVGVGLGKFIEREPPLIDQRPHETRVNQARDLRQNATVFFTADSVKQRNQHENHMDRNRPHMGVAEVVIAPRLNRHDPTVQSRRVDTVLDVAPAKAACGPDFGSSTISS